MLRLTLEKFLFFYPVKIWILIKIKTYKCSDTCSDVSNAPLSINRRDNLPDRLSIVRKTGPSVFLIDRAHRSKSHRYAHVVTPRMTSFYLCQNALSTPTYVSDTKRPPNRYEQITVDDLTMQYLLREPNPYCLYGRGIGICPTNASPS